MNGLMGLKPTKAFHKAIKEEKRFERKQKKNPHEIVFCITSSSGDDRLIWDKRFPDQLKEAQKKFYELLDKGYQLFAVALDGSKSKRKLLRFDPEAEEVIALAPVMGG